MMVMSLIGQLACVAPLLGGRLIVVVSHFSFAHHFLSELTEYSLRTLPFCISYLDPSITLPYPTHTYLHMQEPFPPCPTARLPLLSMSFPFPRLLPLSDNKQGLRTSLCIPRM